MNQNDSTLKYMYSDYWCGYELTNLYFNAGQPQILIYNSKKESPTGLVGVIGTCDSPISDFYVFVEDYLL